MYYYLRNSCMFNIEQLCNSFSLQSLLTGVTQVFIALTWVLKGLKPVFVSFSYSDKVLQKLNESFKLVSVLEWWNDFFGTLGLLLAYVLLPECSVLSFFSPFCFFNPPFLPCVTFSLSLLLSEFCLCLSRCPCPIWLSQVQVRTFGTRQSGLCLHQSNNWRWRVRRVSVSFQSVHVSVLTSTFNWSSFIWRTLSIWVVFSSRKQRTPFLFYRQNNIYVWLHKEKYTGRVWALFYWGQLFSGLIQSKKLEVVIDVSDDPAWCCSSFRPWTAHGGKYQWPRLRACLLRRILWRPLGGDALLHVSLGQPEWW